MGDLEIRKEGAADRAQVDRIEAAAFGRPNECELVRALRTLERPHLSLVALLEGEIVGHVFFSPVTIEGPAPSPPAGGLAPLAVSPSAQGRGAGSALVRGGLEACASLGWGAVFVLGSPDYYSRFGFVSAPALGLHYESTFFDPAFQVIELSAGGLAGCRGWVRYDPAFDGV